MSTVYLNGRFMPLEQACVPVLDRGFLFGDGVYEVVPVYGGRLFRLEQHLLRLGHSLQGIRLADPHEPAAWRALLQELVERNGGGDQSLYLQVTRGSAAKRDHAFPAQITPTVFAMSTALAPPGPALAQHGVAAITLDDIRWRFCHLKAITLLANVLLRQQALDQGAAEAILVRDGEVTEGAASNLFAVCNGVLATPPKGPFLLPGVTRDLILELAAANGIPHQERPIQQRELHSAEEIWLTSSTREILPVTQLDGAPVAAGAPGPLWARMHALYQAYKERVRGGLEA
jgi:D-alanine transaminase